MNKIKELIGGLFVLIVGIYLLVTYLFGMYNLAANNKYSAKELIGGGIFFPYANYIGTKEIISSFSFYDLYPYSTIEILGKQQINKYKNSGYSSKEIDHEAYKRLVMALNNVKEKYRTEDFLNKFHNKEILFQDLKKFTR